MPRSAPALERAPMPSQAESSASGGSRQPAEHECRAISPAPPVRRQRSSSKREYLICASLLANTHANNRIPSRLLLMAGSAHVAAITVRDCGLDADTWAGCGIEPRPLPNHGRLREGARALRRLDEVAETLQLARSQAAGNTAERVA